MNYAVILLLYVFMYIIYAGIILILNCPNYLIKCGGMINYMIATWLKAGANL